MNAMRSVENFRVIVYKSKHERLSIINWKKIGIHGLLPKRK